MEIYIYVHILKCTHTAAHKTLSETKMNVTYMREDIKCLTEQKKNRYTNNLQRLHKVQASNKKKILRQINIEKT